MLPHGFRDLPPELAGIYEFIKKIMIGKFKLYSFEPLFTPHLELWETLKGKYGEEAENMLIWRFVDVWSKTWYALRYDHTVPLARHISTRNYPLPFKRYTIGSVFRHERPQKGRFREFIQADADIIGSPYPEADAELLNLIADIMDALGFEGNYIIKLNDRRILSGILESEIGVQDNLRIFRLVDKLDKIGEGGVLRELSRLIGSNKAKKVLEVVALEGSFDILKEIGNKYSNRSLEEGIEHLSAIRRYLHTRAMEKISISLGLVRGLDYYTGPIWEVIVPNVKLGSVGGGGRYDNLLKLYTKRDLPATGTSFGIDRLVEAGVELGIFTTATVGEVYIIVVSRDCYDYAWHLAQKLRQANIGVAIDLMQRKLSKQREYARKKNFKVLIFVGRKEIKSKKFGVYTKGDRYEVDEDNLVNFVKQILA